MAQPPRAQRDRSERGGGHRHLLYRHGHTVVHRLPAETKIVATVLFTLVVVATPSTARWAFGAYALMIIAVAATARLSPRFVLPRMLVEIPFVLFALLLPFLARGPRVEVLGVLVSASGLESAFAMLAKGTLGVLASIVLAATTELRALLAGLHRLHVPSLLVQIMAFMLRYIEVVGAEADRMRVARTSRCFEARHDGRLRVLAAAAGSLFIRAYERGERVHLAMLSRGYAGGMPVLDTVGAHRSSWALAATLPVAAALVAGAAWFTV